MEIKDRESVYNEIFHKDQNNLHKQDKERRQAEIKK